MSTTSGNEKLPKAPVGHRATIVTIENFVEGQPFTYTDQAGFDAGEAHVQGATVVVWATNPPAPFVLFFADDVTNQAGLRVFPSDKKSQVRINFKKRKPGSTDPENEYKYSAAVVKGDIPIVDDPQVIIDD